LKEKKKKKEIVLHKRNLVENPKDADVASHGCSTLFTSNLPTSMVSQHTESLDNNKTTTTTTTKKKKLIFFFFGSRCLSLLVVVCVCFLSLKVEGERRNSRIITTGWIFFLSFLFED
jgi:hypothetical protein